MPDIPLAEDILPLKLALFNFQKFIGEEEFAAEFLLKGGMRKLIKILDLEGGLRGNALAVRLESTPVTLAQWPTDRTITVCPSRHKGCS